MRNIIFDLSLVAVTHPVIILLELCPALGASPHHKALRVGSERVNLHTYHGLLPQQSLTTSRYVFPPRL